MRKRTGAIIGGVIAAALIASCIMIGVTWHLSDANESQQVQQSNDYGNGVGGDGPVITLDERNEEMPALRNESSTDGEDNVGNVSDAVTSSKIVPDSVYETCERIESISGDDIDLVMDVLDDVDADYVSEEPDDTDNVLYWLYRVSQGDEDGYLALNAVSLFGEMKESGQYDVDDGDIIPTVVNGDNIRAKKTERLLDKETGEELHRVDYVIKYDRSTGMLQSVVANVEIGIITPIS